MAPFEYFAFLYLLYWAGKFFREAPFGILFPRCLFIILAGFIIIYREGRIMKNSLQISTILLFVADYIKEIKSF